MSRLEELRARYLPDGGQIFQDNIFIIGFMGSGKTTISHCLSNICAMEEVEMDSLIAKREGMSIPEIFDTHGEAYFRGLETSLLAEIQAKSNVVVSCGGGTPMREENVEKMKESGNIVLLTAEPETIYERVKNSHDRPLLENNKNVPYIAELMEQRREKYEAAADLIVVTDKKSKYEVCEEIIEKLLETGEEM